MLIPSGLNKNMFKINSFSANPTKWSNTFKQFVGKLPRYYLNVFDHFVGLALKGLTDTRSKSFDVILGSLFS